MAADEPAGTSPRDAAESTPSEGGVFLLPAPNYKVQAGIGQHPSGLRNVTATLDTGAGPNFP